MLPADIKQFRSLLRTALEEGGFVPKRIGPKMPLAWRLPAQEVIPIFFPHEMRTPWGFRLSGLLGIELPALTTWLQARYTGENFGIFRHSFIDYHIANDPKLRDFDAVFGEEVPLTSWVQLLKDRSAALPSTIAALCETYCTRPADLGLFAGPLTRPAWDWLLQWCADPDASPMAPQSFF